MKIDRRVLRASWQSWLSRDNAARVGPWWLAWLWTLAFCALIALAFTLLGFVFFARDAAGWLDPRVWLRWYGRNLVVALAIGVLIHLLFDLARRTVATPGRVRAWRDWQRTLFFAAVPMLGVAIGTPLGIALIGADFTLRLDSAAGLRAALGAVLLSAAITFALSLYFSARARRFAAERRAAEAQLRLLQGQIEPHFLFNTLATVQALLDSDVPRARRMLGSFTEYLRASLGALRRPDATLGDELDLVDTYLALMRERMAERLRYEIRADSTLRTARLPTLALQPLVENAIHHGLEAKREGGRVLVAAHAEDGQLVVEVADDGLGLGAPPRRRAGAGVALANLRERLASRYGDAAGVDLRDAHPGTRATLRVPLEAAT